MIELFTSSIAMAITRPVFCGRGRTAVSELHINCENTFNLKWPCSAVEIEGLGASDPALKFKIENLDAFVEWIEATGARDLRRFAGPCDFAVAAMFSAFNALVTAPSEASSARLARECLTEIARLGIGASSKPIKSGRDAMCRRGLSSVELVGSVRYEADADWSWTVAADQ
ncbi:hypothetical protein MMSR116_00810 [Methylobacterium mesophilicum SR1.6/6]|uniref:Uncharacterized protein n=1 Tax=Methylobacterium mesophilicum SR1.6/6 TaxID=908290 RepID=A0A6B9FI84_9HYPH|nr:hypothetical protein [Methylobacterium mesophilicum]QGY00608.1 hypothetical protein MMSR116_00810 [Methylobacterium mesophilicum SR1.6/6]